MPNDAEGDPMLAWLLRASDEYASRKAAAESAVVRWDWRSDADRALEPGYFERSGNVRGRVLPAPSSPSAIASGTVAYGLDAEGRTRVERRYFGLRDDDSRDFFETFYAYTEDTIEAVNFHCDVEKPAMAVRRADVLAGRVLVLRSRAHGNGTTERFHYEGDRLTRVECWDANGTLVSDFQYPANDLPHLKEG